MTARISFIVIAAAVLAASLGAQPRPVEAPRAPRAPRPGVGAPAPSPRAVPAPREWEFDADQARSFERAWQDSELLTPMHLEPLMAVEHLFPMEPLAPMEPLEPMMPPEPMMPLAPMELFAPMEPIAPMHLESLMEMPIAMSIPPMEFLWDEARTEFHVDAPHAPPTDWPYERPARAPRAFESRTDRLASVPPAPWAKGDQADTLYTSAREMLNRGEYRRAAQLFRDLSARFPRSAYAADALYWEAFALYRIGTTTELRDALKALESQRSRFPEAKTQADAAVLATRIQGALAARGDSRASAQLTNAATQQSGSCDKEDQAVRVEALSALGQSDPESVTPILRRVLARRDECSAALRRRAVFLLGRKADAAAEEALTDVARNETDPQVRSDAIMWLARMPGEKSVATLEEILRSSSDERTQRAAIRALTTHPSPRARQGIRALIERTDASEKLRAEAIGSFDKERSTSEDAAYLRGVYAKLDSPRLKERTIYAVARFGGAENEQWLLNIARQNDEPIELRAAALRRAAGTSMPIADVVKMYDGVSDRELREQLIQVYSSRKEPEATDKLLDIVRTGTDPQLRRLAISGLTRKNDPRTTKLLLEIIDK